MRRLDFLLLDRAQTPSTCARRQTGRYTDALLGVGQVGHGCARWSRQIRISSDMLHSPCLDCDQLEGVSGRAFYDYESDRLGQFVQT